MFLCIDVVKLKGAVAGFACVLYCVAVVPAVSLYRRHRFDIARGNTTDGFRIVVPSEVGW